MTTTTTRPLYKPATPEQIKRQAALVGARHFGTEAVAVYDAAGDDFTTVVFVVTGRDPRGWNLLGDSILVSPEGDIMPEEQA